MVLNKGHTQEELVGEMRGTVSLPLTVPGLNQRKMLRPVSYLMPIFDPTSSKEEVLRKRHQRKCSKKSHLHR